MRGKEIPPPIVSELKLFALCDAMKWSHLPMRGGLYDQHPGLLDRFYYILAERAKHEAAEQERRNRESGPRGGLSSRSPGRGRRR